MSLVSRCGRHRRGLSLLLAWCLAGAAGIGPAAAVVRAAGITFGTPTATSTFGKSIAFSQPVEAGGTRVSRVEILITVPGSLGPDATEVAVGSSGTLPASLTYSFDVSSGELSPNTPVEARWRVIDAGGGVSLGPAVEVRYLDTRFAWRTKVGSLVRVHWYQGDDAFATRALAIGESGIAKAAALLGVTESQPIDFYIYADQGPFNDALGPGSRENVGGLALPEIRTLFALITPAEVNDSWVSIVIPHELTHVVFDTAVHNPYHDPPHWLNEGLAVYLTEGNDATDRATLQAALSSQTVMPLAALAGQFPTTQAQFFLAYAEAVSAVDFLVATYGKPALVSLIRSYAGGVTDDQAFRTALGITTSAFDAAWLAHVGARSPQQFGPIAAPAGPVPSGWTGNPVASGNTGAGSNSSPTPQAASPAESTSSNDGLALAGIAAAGAALVLGLGVLVILRRRPTTGGGDGS